ncbi:hypothetical protein Zmor_011756 [Zophobas morio]|uniref:RRM domain-containing protein n=1 Tax=Zophobas morio TaxID=2755281 RepID=A0AA38LZC0_9CUCU|nr:hypothetical protein Zmor_011756 [Zophobas morio]
MQGNFEPKSSGKLSLAALAVEWSTNHEKLLDLLMNESRATTYEIYYVKASWHEDYRHSAYLYFGGLSKSLTEGDIIAVFSQYGEILDINLIRDKQSGESRGFGFLAYEDQRSTDLAVDNLNGIQLLGWTMRVNHVKEYRPPSAEAEEEKQVGFVDPYSQMERKRESERCCLY